jgi:hypothetical protein
VASNLNRSFGCGFSFWTPDTTLVCADRRFPSDQLRQKAIT